jgi:radical SAM superfamily enzyme YgiQ (UPF0313 family)
VKLADLRMLLGWEEYEKLLERIRPDFVGVSIHSVEWSFAVEAARRAKKAVPRVKTIAGGVHPTMFPDECAAQDAFDYVLKGEGEVSLPLLVENPSRFERVFWGETPDLDAVPFPDRDVWPDIHVRMNNEPFGIRGYSFPLPMAEMISTRGCP